MKIIEHGKMPEPSAKVTRRFKCIRCGCIFEADDGEYEYGIVGFSACWDGFPLRTKRFATCPECGAGSEEVEA